MFCQKCGKQLREGAKFCNYCGFRITYAAPVTPPNAAEKRPPVEDKPVKSQTPPKASPETKPHNKKRLLLLTLAAIIVVAVIITIVALTSHHTPEEPNVPSASDTPAVSSTSEEPEPETEPEAEAPTAPPTEAVVISDEPLIFNDDLLAEFDMSYGELVQRYGSTTAVNYDYLKMYGTSFDFESAPGRTYLFKTSVPTDSPYGASSCNDGDPCERIVAPIGEVFTNFGDSCTVGELKARLPQYTVVISGFGTYGCPTLQLFTEELNGFDILLAIDSSGSPYQLGIDVEDDYVLLPDLLVSITKNYK